MAQGYKLWKGCDACKGTGLVKETDGLNTKDVECYWCVGRKFIFWGWCTADTVEMPDMGE